MKTTQTQDPMPNNDWPAVRHGLGSNEWLELCSAEPRTEDEHPYYYVHEARCHGNIVAVLPYKRAAGHEGKTNILYGMRREVTPAWGERHNHSALTGGCEDDETPRETAARELAEEAGYEVDSEYITFLGRCRGTKSSDTIYHLYAVDVTDVKYDASLASGDGTKHDSEGYTTFVNQSTCFRCCVDPVFFTMMAALLAHSRLEHI